MERVKIHELIIDRIMQRLVRMGMSERDVTADLDLVRSGLLDSLSFVDLIADLETACGKQVDLENAMNSTGATTVKGVTEMFN